MSTSQPVSGASNSHFLQRHRSRILSSLGTAGVLLLPIATYALYNPVDNSSQDYQQTPNQKSVQGVSTEESRSEKQESDPDNSEPQSGTSTSSTQVTVNGQSIPVPSSGSVHQSMPTNDGNGTVTVDVHNQSNAQNSPSNNDSSSINVQVNSSSQTDGGGFNSSSTSTFINSQNFSQSSGP